jgi:hypothetical protein
MIRQRDLSRIGDLTQLREYRGHPVFSKYNPVK